MSYDIALKQGPELRERERGMGIRPACQPYWVCVGAIKPEFYFNLPPLGVIYGPIGPFPRYGTTLPTKLSICDPAQIR